MVLHRREKKKKKAREQRVKLNKQYTKQFYGISEKKKKKTDLDISKNLNFARSSFFP